MMKRSLLAILMIVVLLAGCSNKTDSDDSGAYVSLVCSKQIEGEACDEYRFDDEQSIKLLEEAISHAELMNGTINYVAEYNLTVASPNQDTKKYHLSLRTDRSMNGLLVDLADTNQGYSIPNDYANRLRDLIAGIR